MQGKPSAGDLLEDRFRLREKIGRGGGGVVFRAHDAVLGRDVALKTIETRDADQIYRLKQEFRRLLDLSHPNLVQLYDLIAHANGCFFTMELLDGVDVVRWVRGELPPGILDDEALDRLRRSFRQLAEGIVYLHASGHLHRDIKPHNVMACRDGRVVLLDFGLAVRERTLSQNDDEGFVGTVDYVAPEQAWGGGSVAASDWYGVGVSMYEALTGRLPFDGAAAQQLQAKLAQPPRPSHWARGIPEDLDELAHRLLDPTPGNRPPGGEVLAALRGDCAATPRAQVVVHPADDDRAPFVGREAELGRLERLAARVAGGELRVVHVRASSGIGKSALARRFVEAAEQSRDALVLRGRCHPKETVHFGALDSVVDDLSHYLIGLSDDAVGHLAPRNPAALLRLFPVMGRVAAFAAADAALPNEPRELRRLGVQALRELLTRIGEHRFLVVWIDDAHWGDRDSAPLLRELLRAPQPPRLLMILTYRGEDEATSPMLREFERLHDEGESSGERLDLSPLSADDSRHLAAALGADDATLGGHQLEAIARESAGSPFFVGELVRYARGAGTELAVGESAGGWSSPSVEAVVTARLSGLERTSSDLLELVAVAGQAIDLDMALDLAGPGGAGRPLVRSMSQQCLVRTRIADAVEQVEAYHDRIRETVLTNMLPEVRRQRHRQLADRLSRAESPDLYALVEHFSGAGDNARASDCAIRAAAAAAEALAFDKSAQLYGRALELSGDRAEDWPIRVSRAEALGDAGQSAEAAGEFERAAGDAERIAPDRRRRLTLLRHAGEHYLYSGRLEKGVELVSGALAELGSPISPKPGLRPLLQRVRLFWRTRHFAKGDRIDAAALASAASPPPVELLDALETAARGLSMQDHQLADELSVRHLLGAIERGEPSRLARALAMEAAAEATVGGAWLSRRSRGLLASARQLAEYTDNPYDRMGMIMNEGALEWVSSNWRECRARCEEALELMPRAVRHPPAAAAAGSYRGTPWDSNLIYSFLLGALYQLGCIDELSRILPERIADARARSDLFALTLLQANELVIVPLARDDPAGAMRAVEAAAIPMQDGCFATAHYHHLVGTVKIDLYAGRGTSASQRIERVWKALTAAGFLRLGGVTLHLRYVRACAALACAAQSSGAESRDALRVAKREAAALARIPLSNGPPLAAAVESVVAGAAGHRRRQIEALERALAGFDASDMVLCSHAAHIHLAHLRDDAETRQRAAASEQWMRDQGVVNPAALAACTVPAPIL